MRFVHIADIHFDTPFTLLSDRADLGEVRRLDQRKAFKKMIEYIKENEIPYLFIAGDLYDHEYVRQSTIDFINDCFKQILDTKIYITPGNHDPYLKNSYYTKYKWSQNVKIFTSKVEKVETNEFDLYGYGFEDFYLKESKIDKINIENKEKLNILITHASLDGGYDDQRHYNTISSSKLKGLGFDYIALGHIHKLNLSNENKNMIYPGSTIALGFDELGEHGMIIGNIENKQVKIEFVKLDEKEFREVQIDITNINEPEELLQILEEIDLNEKDLYKIILTGNRNFEINTYKLYRQIETRNIIKVKDKTKIGYNLNKIANSTTLKGIFAKEMLYKLKDENIDKETLEKAIEIGMEALS